MNISSLAIVIGLVSYAPYIYHLVKGKTKPHAFSWFIWGVLTAIAFFAQMQKGGGTGAWVTGVTAAVTFFIAFSAFIKNGIQHIMKVDWFCLIAALIGIVLWKVTNNPLAAVIIVTIVDAISFLPTFRKAFYLPHEETAFTFVLSSIKFLLSLFALEAYNLTTVLYPAYLVLVNATFVVMVFLRRTYSNS